MKAVIIRSINNTYIAKAEDGKQYDLRIKGKVLTSSKLEYNPICSGDYVEFTPHSESEGLITNRLERKSTFTRFLNKVSLNQTIVSNMDQAVIVSSVKTPAFHPRFIDRAIACLKGCEIIIAINKADLKIDEEESDIALYEELGYPVVLLSALKGDAEDLMPYLKGKKTAFIGPSGVGKSSLVNLITGSKQRIGEINEKYNRGRHTTNHALYIEKDDMVIIDTPGIREIIPPVEELTELRDSFIELRNLDCKYSNCLHRGEDGCCVPSLIDNGIIDEDRYFGYLSLLEQSEEIARRIREKRW